jgi:molybdenum cofactor sulfurtransferase
MRLHAGILCNPGAAYRDVGVTEEEVATLAEEKEGCDDEIDFISVQRPDSSAVAPLNGIVTDADIMPVIENGCAKLGHPAEVALKWVRKPLGSVRVSLGYMSTWEDVDSFVNFMDKSFKDRRGTCDGQTS